MKRKQTKTLSCADVAELKGVALNTVYTAIGEGDLISTRRGRVHRVTPTDADAWQPRSPGRPVGPAKPPHKLLTEAVLVRWSPDEAAALRGLASESRASVPAVIRRLVSPHLFPA